MQRAAYLESLVIMRSMEEIGMYVGAAGDDVPYAGEGWATVCGGSALDTAF